MCEYLNSKIYKIVCETTGEVYIGSTKLSLEDRLKYHLNQNNQACSKQIIDRNKYYIEQLESYPCNSKQELERKEGEYQRAFECININIAGRTKLEYYHDNKERIDEYHKQYCLDNKEKMDEYHKQYSLDNKEKIDEYNKQYYLENAEKIKAQQSKVVICECGVKSWHNNLSTHKLTKKHKTLMSNLNQPSSDPLVLEMPVQNQVGRISSH